MITKECKNERSTLDMLLKIKEEGLQLGAESHMGYYGIGTNGLNEIIQSLTQSTTLDSDAKLAKVTLSQWKDDINECDYPVLDYLLKLVEKDNQPTTLKEE